MITYVYGDLFQSPAKVLVNAVNTVVKKYQKSDKPGAAKENQPAAE